MEDEQRSKDLDELENLKMGYAALNEDYKIQIERLKTADQKSNMLLVFNAAILALLVAVLPLNESARAIFILSVIALTLFIVSMILTLITIIVAIFPRKTTNLSSKSYTTAEFYHRSNQKFMGQIMGQFNQSITELHKVTEHKFLCQKVAMIATLGNIAFMAALIILNIL